MIIVIPKEVKNNENRVSILPFGVEELSKCVHQIIIQSQARIGSVFADGMYRDMGANIAGRLKRYINKLILTLRLRNLSLKM